AAAAAVAGLRRRRQRRQEDERGGPQEAALEEDLGERLGAPPEDLQTDHRWGTHLTSRRYGRWPQHGHLKTTRRRSLRSIRDRPRPGCFYRVSALPIRSRCEERVAGAEGGGNDGGPGPQAGPTGWRSNDYPPGVKWTAVQALSSLMALKPTS